MVKLHLGCRDRKIHGFINIDIMPEAKPDLVEDVITLPSFDVNSVNTIYCCHLSEHLTREESLKAFTRWHEILEPGGILRLSVPDLARVFEHYMLYKDLRKLQCFLYGSQHNEFDIHKNGWDEKTLYEELMSVGFINFRRYDHKNTEHWYVDDHAAAYLPHMDSKNGTLMSLNVEVTK